MDIAAFCAWQRTLIRSAHFLTDSCKGSLQQVTDTRWVWAMQLSSDGLLRLSIGELLSLPIQHLMSGVDTETALHRILLTEACGRPTHISGYTEWVSASAPAVSIGWDWQLQLHPVPQWWSQPLLAQPPYCWARLGPPRTNVMLVYAAGGDTGWHKNLELLSTVVDALPWQDRLLRAVGFPTEPA